MHTIHVGGKRHEHN